MFEYKKQQWKTTKTHKITSTRVDPLWPPNMIQNDIQKRRQNEPKHVTKKTSEKTVKNYPDHPPMLPRDAPPHRPRRSTWRKGREGGFPFQYDYDIDYDYGIVFDSFVSDVDCDRFSLADSMSIESMSRRNTSVTRRASRRILYGGAHNSAPWSRSDTRLDICLTLSLPDMLKPTIPRPSIQL